MKNHCIGMIAVLASIFALSGCGSAWVIQRSDSGGIIGYQNYHSPGEATKAISALIHCPNYHIDNDELRTSSSTAYMPIQSTSYNNGTVYNQYGQAQFSGTNTRTDYVPTNITNSWREVRYSCTSFEPVRSEASEKSDLSPRAKCENECGQLYAQNLLKKGMNQASCIKKMCN